MKFLAMVFCLVFFASCGSSGPSASDYAGLWMDNPRSYNANESIISFGKSKPHSGHHSSNVLNIAKVSGTNYSLKEFFCVFKLEDGISLADGCTEHDASGLEYTKSGAMKAEDGSLLMLKSEDSKEHTIIYAGREYYRHDDY